MRIAASYCREYQSKLRFLFVHIEYRSAAWISDDGDYYAAALSEARHFSMLPMWIDARFYSTVVLCERNIFKCEHSLPDSSEFQRLTHHSLFAVENFSNIRIVVRIPHYLTSNRTLSHCHIRNRRVKCKSQVNMLRVKDDSKHK